MEISESNGLGGSMNFSFHFENDTELNKTFQGFDYGLLVPSSEATKPVAVPKEYMSVWAKAAWSTAFAAMVVTSTAGNLIVIWIVIGKSSFATR
ncbi:unnamed protein product [Acanthoscelides obtectus]|uniref:Uncharacterized protein n=1 Tax=Acanthoscelides obtectus TaxID=200917 RepID=A0A9P0L457_ACAOB|nr:unnamed protein product [Acanthoscelides obtectus]CAK1649260.1 hypothetical protein AOBTE_LOCUS16117 [Acanthoscelides obtectus]